MPPYQAAELGNLRESSPALNWAWHPALQQPLETAEDKPGKLFCVMTQSGACQSCLRHGQTLLQRRERAVAAGRDRCHPEPFAHQLGDCGPVPSPAALKWLAEQAGTLQTLLSPPGP